MKTMQKLAAVAILGIVMLSAAFVGVASAQQTSTPFTSQTNYMSQTGYDRFLNHQQTNVWTRI